MTHPTITPAVAEALTDAILALFERAAVERERKAFVDGWEAGKYESENGEPIDGCSDPEAEAARRYPLPKEE